MLEYYAGLQEAWDGPALLTFCDGKQIGAQLDRNLSPNPSPTLTLTLTLTLTRCAATPSSRSNCSWAGD